MQKKVIHKTLGEITISQTRRAKRISLSVRPPGVVRLAFPPRVTINEAVRFAESKQAWVLRNIEKYKSTHLQPIIPPYSTLREQHSLRLASDKESYNGREKGGRITIKVKEGIIEITHPDHLPINDQELQNSIRKGIEQAWRVEAKDIIPLRVKLLSEEFGFKYGKVTIRNSVSRWGSCSAKNDLSLSLHLMRLPDHLLDYIILHELCHTVHKNHGPKFHALLNKVTSEQHPILHQELRKHNTRW